eukprot:COSAG02_NODE_5588_length_4208_cov_464.272086_4_plen_68_part_00
MGGSPGLARSRVGQWVCDNSGFRTGGSVGCDGGWESNCPHPAEERNPAPAARGSRVRAGVQRRDHCR